jgi:AcrR family transcriptional regulator
MARKTAADAEITRQNLVAAGIEVFAEYGYSGATLEKVAQRAGVSRGAVYWHFKGKDELLDEVLNDSVLPLEDFLQHGATFEEGMNQLRSAMGATFGNQRCRQLCEIMLQKSERIDEFSPIAIRLHCAQERFYEQLNALLAEAVFRGDVSEEIDVPASTSLLQVCFTGMIVECLRQPLEVSRHLASTLNTLCMMIRNPPQSLMR